MKSKLLYERALITCVLMLIVSIILKLFGVPWFNLDTSIPILNKIDDVVMSSNVLSFIYSFTFVFINTILILMITLKRYDKKMIFPCLIFVITSMCIKMFIKIDVLSFMIDTVGILLLCVFIDRNVSVKEYLLTFIVNTLYQVISIFIRDLNYQIAFRGMVIGVLMNIDYYLMLIITYLYLKKGDKTLCGIFLHCGSSLANLLWKKPTQNSNQCSSKEM